ncbi:MAG: hypothetical protein ACYDCO_27085 [Armatimonadota bacterium]
MRTSILLVSITLLLVLSRRCETMTEMLSGKTFPLSMPIKALNAEWRQFTLTGAGGGAADMLTVMARMQAGGIVSELYVTQGKTVTIGSETYLVVYHREQQVKVNGGDWAVTMTPVTPEGQLVLSLLNLRAIGCMLDIRPFDINNLQGGATLMTGAMARAQRKAKESTLKANLHQLRNALEQFQADTGLYPEKLTDLTLAKANAPKRGLDDQKKLVDLPAGAYHGPYLAVAGGIGGTGIPMNPFADPNNADPDAHWAYSIDGPGFVYPAVPKEGTTIDGIQYVDL